MSSEQTQYIAGTDYALRGWQATARGPAQQIHCLLNDTEVYVEPGETIQTALDRSRRKWAEARAKFETGKVTP